MPKTLARTLQSINQSKNISIALFPQCSIALGRELIKQICFKSTTENCERSRVSKRRRKRVPEIGTRVGERAFSKRMLNSEDARVITRKRTKTRLRRDLY